ncbi:MAG: flagellar motor switch protein FliM [Phycisphaerales bacterium]|nr:flagellar motor switch protein FliM [Phycisphaerales bacterium]
MLDQSDLDLLLSAVAAGDVEQQSVTPMIFSRHRESFEDVEIRDYDFARPERISKDQMRAVQTLHETFARNFGASLSGFLRTIVEVRLVSADQMTYAEFIASLPNPTSFNLLRAKTLDGQMCLELSPLIIYPIIDRLLGGTNHELFIPQRPMTTIETRLVRAILDRAVTVLSEAWSGIEALEFEFGDMESNPQLVQIVAPNEVVIVVGFEIRMANRAGTMSLCMPFNVIEPLMDRIGSQSWFAASRRGDSHWSAILGDRLQDAGLDVNAVLARTTMSVDELRGLQVGDLIMTDKPAAEPVSLWIEGLPKFLGHIGKIRGNRALRIDRVVRVHDRY